MALSLLVHQHMRRKTFNAAISTQWKPLKTFTDRAKALFYNSPSQSVDAVSVIYSKLSTQPRWGKAFSCSLRVEIPISQELIDIILNKDDLLYTKDEMDKISNNLFTKTGKVKIIGSAITRSSFRHLPTISVFSVMKRK
nr:hypothetical protein KXZ65_04175 [Pectobacterium sp. PL152]